MSSSFREELINSVDERGRDLYRQSLDAIPTVVGRSGHIAAIHLRVIKGAQQLFLDEARLTTNGLGTVDGNITDCSAAMIKRKNGEWKRYSGKDSPNPTRLFTSYDEVKQMFSIWSEADDGSPVMLPKKFSTSYLKPRKGKVISAKITQGTIEGVLENGPLTAHIQDCLRPFEDDVENIAVLLRHPAFHRPSDTRTPPQTDRNTLYTDGSQIHVMNQNTILNWQNMHMQRQMTMASYRAGLEISGDDMLPNIEDLIYRIRIETQDYGDIPVDFTSLTPRCLVTQRDVRTGAVNSEPKLWNRMHRPLRPWDGVATMGANADMDPALDGAVICVGDRFIVESEKTEWTQ